MIKGDGLGSFKGEFRVRFGNQIIEVNIECKCEYECFDDGIDRGNGWCRCKSSRLSNCPHSASGTPYGVKSSETTST